MIRFDSNLYFSVESLFLLFILSEFYFEKVRYQYSEGNFCWKCNSVSGDWSILRDITLAGMTGYTISKYFETNILKIWRVGQSTLKKLHLIIFRTISKTSRSWCQPFFILNQPVSWNNVITSVQEIIIMVFEMPCSLE